MARIGEGAAQLDQQRLQTDPELERGLAAAAAVEVGSRPQEQRLAGVDPLAPAEHRGDPLLRAQVCAAPPPASRRATSIAAGLVTAVGDLVAAAEADPHHDRLLGVRSARRDRRRRCAGRGGPG